MIYLFEGSASIPEELIKKIFPLMPAERQKKAQSYRFTADHNACVIAYGLLLCGMLQEYGTQRLPRFTYGKNGKPYLEEHPDIFFNMSHCKMGIVCAVSNNEVGVDIQEIQPFDMNMARCVCTANEIVRLKQSGTPDCLFCKLWTLKEAYIKQYGGSIADSPEKIETEDLPFFTIELANIRSYLCCTDTGNTMINRITCMDLNNLV